MPNYLLSIFIYKIRNMNEFPIHDAIRAGDLRRVRQLIKAGVPVDTLNEAGQAPLHWAAYFDQYKMVKLLIESECDLDIKDSYGRTPAMWAAEGGKRNIVGLLLHRGAQVNCVGVDMSTLLHYACRTDGWAYIVRLILDKGEADLNALDKYGKTPLMYATMSENEEVAVLLIQGGADVNVRNSNKRTALHCAAEYNDDSSRMVQILLEKEGLDLSPQDVYGQTPLHLACKEFGWAYSQEVIKELLDAGADTSVKNNQGRTALSEGIWEMSLTHEEIRLFVQKGAFLENCDYEWISKDPILKENVLTDVQLCTQSVINKFNRQSLAALNSIAYFARRLPNIDHFKLGARAIEEVENLVKCEIERNTFCNVVKVHPISLSALCVLSLITCQSGKKRAASPDFGHLPFKKIHSETA